MGSGLSLTRSLLTDQTICSFLLLVGDHVFAVGPGFGSDSVQRQEDNTEPERKRQTEVNWKKKAPKVEHCLGNGF